MVEKRDGTQASPAGLFPPAILSRSVLTGAAIGLALAVAAFLAGATQFAIITLITVATATVVERMVAYDQARLARKQRASEERNHRETVEKLADRMWELSESEERFRGLVDALGDIVVHRDKDGAIVFANRALSDLTGIAPNALIGRHLDEIGFETNFSGDDSGLDNHDMRHLGPHGVRWYSWVELSTRDEGTGAVQRRAIGRDMTERKASEEALIAARQKAESGSAAKSRFLATVSHEIRTPLNGIMGMATLLADTGLSDEQRNYAAAITTSGTALLELIEDLLDFARIEAGHLDLAAESASPRDIAEAVVELLSARAYAKGIGLGVTIRSDVPARVTCDPGKLRQILVNLVGNAIKFTGTGGVAITVSREEGEEGERIRFSVRDTGPGIAQSDIARIFEDFEQADGSTTRAHGGAGLGLAISRRIAEAMGGKISVTSDPGIGSTFDFVLPAEDAVPSERGRPLQERRVLVVLTDVNEAETVAQTIRCHGGRAEIASDRVAALRMIDDGEGFDVALIGVAFEASMGELLARLRARAREARALALLTPSERGRLDALRAKGCDGYLVRPVRVASLLRMLGDRAQPSAPKARQAGRLARAIPRIGLKILVAEDNPVNALLVRATLDKAGHVVEVVGDGRAAVEAIARGRFDVVLMDLHMPVMDGLDALARIRSHEEARGDQPVPILVLTADGQEETRRQALAHGANGVVIKPLDPLALIATVEEQAAA